MSNNQPTPQIRLIMYTRKDQNDAWTFHKSNPVIIPISPLATNPQQEANEKLAQTAKQAADKYGQENVTFIPEDQHRAISIVCADMLMSFQKHLIEHSEPGDN